MNELEANKAVVRRSLEDIYNGGNVGAIPDVFSDDFVGWDPTFPNGELRGHAGIRGNVERGHQSFTDWHFSIEEMIAERDMVLVRVIMHARHTSPFLGRPASGANLEVSGMTLNRIKDGRIVERWGNWNTIGMLQQMGVLPPLDKIG